MAMRDKGLEVINHCRAAMDAAGGGRQLIGLSTEQPFRWKDSQGRTWVLTSYWPPACEIE